MSAYPDLAKKNPYRSAGEFHVITPVIAAEVGNSINVALTLKNARGQPIAEGPCIFDVYLSDDPDGIGITGTSPSGVTIGTNGAIITTFTAVKHFKVCSTKLGLIDLNIAYASAHQFYLIVVLPIGRPRVYSVLFV